MSRLFEAFGFSSERPGPAPWTKAQDDEFLRSPGIVPSDDPPPPLSPLRPITDHALDQFRRQIMEPPIFPPLSNRSTTSQSPTIDELNRMLRDIWRSGR